MKIVICDDDIIIRNQMECYIKEYFDSKKIQQPEIFCFESGEELIDEEEAVADIAFLDVKMQEVSGIEAGEVLKKRKVDTIIFIITTFEEYLDEAMRYRVFRYLTKPIDKDRLFRNLKDALYRYNTVSQKVAIETKTGVVAVYMTEIICIEAKERHVYVYCRDDKYESIKTMQYWQDILLPHACFFQTHRSYIVNMRYVSEFDRTMVSLKQGEGYAYLTRREYRHFKDAYMLYLESMH